MQKELESCNIGIVAIGRNEENRLEKTLHSLKSYQPSIVYVDSGSTDNSVAIAKENNISVVSLDPEKPFSAARGRNEGFEYICENHTELEFIQFLDADCELAENWIETACKALSDNADVAAVCGRRHEKFKNKSIYNKMTDLEWNTPIGETKACGGDRMVRVSAFREVDGYDETFIAGEDPELCFRLRAEGHRILRLDADMTWHDIDLMHFRPWWVRNVRTGYAFSKCNSLHGQSEEKFKQYQIMRNWFWALFLPLVSLISAVVIHPGFLLLLLAYPLQIIRIALRRKLKGIDNWKYAGLSMVCKFAETQGQLKFLADRFKTQKSTLIEYK